MKIDLTKDQCKSLIEFIELYLLDVIRKDPEIDSLEWVQNIMTADTLFHLAIAVGENPPEVATEAPEELTKKEMADAIDKVCEYKECVKCPLSDFYGDCTDDKVVERNYRIMKEAGLFDKKEEEWR